MTTDDSSDQSRSSSGGEDEDSLMNGADVVSPSKKSATKPKKGVAAKKAAAGASSSKNPAKVPAKRGRKKRPKDMPQRPLSAYNLFFRAEREDIIKTTSPETIISTAETIRGPEVSAKAKKRINLFQALAVLISKKWKTLGPEDRTAFDKMAKEEMTAYRKKLGDYQIQLVRKSMSASNGGDLDDTGGMMKEDSGKGSASDSKLKSKPTLPPSSIPAGIATAPAKLLGGPTGGFNTLGGPGVAAPGGASGSMFSPSMQAQFNVGQLSGARMGQGGDQSSTPQGQLPSAGQQGGAGISNPAGLLARQQQQFSSMDPYLQGHFDSSQGFSSAGAAGMPSYFQDLMLAQQQQQQFGQFGMQAQQGDFMQRMQALQQVPQGSQGFPTGLDPATASFYGLTQGFPSAGGSSGLTPDLQAFLQQQQQGPGAPASTDSWNPALTGQRSGQEWSYLLNAGGGADASSLAAMGGIPTAPGPTNQNSGSAGELGGGHPARNGNNSDQLSDVLRMLQQQQQQSFRQAPNY